MVVTSVPSSELLNDWLWLDASHATAATEMRVAKRCGSQYEQLEQQQMSWGEGTA